MRQFLSISGEAALVALSVLSLFLAALLLRNPWKPKWLDLEGVAVFAALTITVMISVSYGAFVSGLMNVGVEFPFAFAAGIVCWTIHALILWTLMRMRARLNACEAGRSPLKLFDTDSPMPRSQQWSAEGSTNS